MLQGLNFLSLEFFLSIHVKNYTITLCFTLIFSYLTMFVLQDCFFVSVVIRNHPELHDKPVAVCHSDNPRGTAEISSANYPARAYGWY